MDARCLLRAIDAVPARKSPKQAWIFSVSPTITPQGLCIHRKAINMDKPTVLLDFFSTTDWTDLSDLLWRK